ncbi:TAXI family TRAP transporter solute-binding subunit [Acuticoccus sp.]|uniref:TAXI family TRAP transporter solute-binding subunit n=1 Tax=Acuticoccus sp. TaxID=1904378 RepID=UPI003B52E956
MRALVAGFTLATASGSALPAKAQDGPSNISIVTGNAGGSFYPVGVAMAKILSDEGISASAEPGGGNSNVMAVSQGQADIGFTFGPTVTMATAGEDPFPTKFGGVVALASLYPNYTQVAVTTESGVTDIADLKGKPFATQGQSAGSSTFFRMLLEANGLTEDDLDIVVRGGPTQGANAVRDRTAVGFQATTGFPNASFSEAFISVPMRILPVSDEAAAALVEANPSFSRAVLPAGTYHGQDEDAPTVSVDTILIVNADMPEEHAYQIVKTLAENAAALERSTNVVSGFDAARMADISGITVHPGAARYYREQGLQ